MLDKATVLTTIFTRVDDTMKGSTVIQQALKRPGPAPSLSGSRAGHHRPLAGTDRGTARRSLFPPPSGAVTSLFPGIERTQSLQPEKA